MAKVCPSCKESYPNTQTFCPKCRVLTDFAPEPEAPITRQPMPANQGYYHMAVGRRMKWFKFLIYFALFFSAVVYGFTALAAIAAGFTGTLADGLDTAQRVVLMIYGFALLALTVAILVARKKLAGFRKNAGTFYLRVRTAEVCCAAFVNFAVCFVGDISYVKVNGGMYLNLELSADLPSAIFSLVVNLAILYANFVYFKKRRNLFVN